MGGTPPMTALLSLGAWPGMASKRLVMQVFGLGIIAMLARCSKNDVPGTSLKDGCSIVKLEFAT